MLSVFERRGIGRRRVHTCREDDDNRDNATGRQTAKSDTTRLWRAVW